MVVCAGEAASGEWGARVGKVYCVGGGPALVFIDGVDCATGSAAAGCVLIGLGVLALSGSGSASGATCSCLRGALDAYSEASLPLNNRDVADAARSKIDGLLVCC